MIISLCKNISRTYNYNRKSVLMFNVYYKQNYNTKSVIAISDLDNLDCQRQVHSCSLECSSSHLCLSPSLPIFFSRRVIFHLTFDKTRYYHTRRISTNERSSSVCDCEFRVDNWVVPIAG